MNREFAKMIVDNTDTWDERLSVRDGYSGRSMYGKETCGIVYDNLGDLMRGIAQTAADLAFEDESRLEDFMEELENIRLDNMGLSMIVY